MWSVTFFCFALLKIISSEKLNSRIVGGKQVTIEQFPHQISITLSNGYFCGGLIISERYILTAAHCALNVIPSTVTLRVGSSYHTNGTIIPVVEVTPHPEYNKHNFHMDIAYMKTAKQLEFSKTIQPIMLSPKGRPVNGTVSVSGWGVTRYGDKWLPNTTLSAVDLPVINFTLCQSVYRSFLNEDNFCAGYFYSFGPSTCQGDSGGAAIQDGMAVGSVSFGDICGAPFNPSVFVNFASPAIRDFITINTGV